MAQCKLKCFIDELTRLLLLCKYPVHCCGNSSCPDLVTELAKLRWTSAQDPPGCKGKQVSAGNSEVYIKVSKMLFLYMGYILPWVVHLASFGSALKRTRNRTLALHEELNCSDFSFFLFSCQLFSYCAYQRQKIQTPSGH